MTRGNNFTLTNNSQKTLLLTMMVLDGTSGIFPVTIWKITRLSELQSIKYWKF